VRAPMEKAARKKRRASHRRSTQDYQYYFVLVDRWEHSYSFGPSGPRFHQMLSLA
jgi:hypothetical protein